jgi:hypothetical protein
VGEGTRPKAAVLDISSPLWVGEFSVALFYVYQMPVTTHLFA